MFSRFTYMKKISFVFFLLTLSYTSYSQDIFRLNVDTISSRDLLFQEVEDTIMITRKKKKKKNVFFGIKTKKGFIKTTNGRNNIYENFFYIKEPELKNNYAQELYFYDKKKKKIVKSRKILEGAVMLHGSYIKRFNDQVIESGLFYFGLKQNRWVRLNRSDILQDKEIYSLGWYNESIRYFWDIEKQKLKEVLPIKYGEKNGNYYAFHLNGEIAARGKFLHDQRIGLWTEFYDTGKKKREINYNDDPFNTNKQFIVREWNNNGKLIYDRTLFLKRNN